MIYSIRNSNANALRFVFADFRLNSRITIKKLPYIMRRWAHTSAEYLWWHIVIWCMLFESHWDANLLFPVIIAFFSESSSTHNGEERKGCIHQLSVELAPKAVLEANKSESSRVHSSQHLFRRKLAYLGYTRGMATVRERRQLKQHQFPHIKSSTWKYIQIFRC